MQTRPSAGLHSVVVEQIVKFAGQAPLLQTTFDFAANGEVTRLVFLAQNFVDIRRLFGIGGIDEAVFSFFVGAFTAIFTRTIVCGFIAAVIINISISISTRV